MQKMMVGYQAVKAKISHAKKMVAARSYGGCGLACCAGNRDMKLLCYLLFYISILEDFSHADEQVGGWIGQDEQAGQRPMHAEPHAAVMPRPLLTQPQP